MATSKKKSASSRSRKPTSNIKEQIKDLYFKDLPNDLQKTLMEVHKMIVAQCQATWKNKLYDDIRESDWAKSMFDEFLTMPMAKSNVGSVRIYKKKNRYSCMIQITGHVPNNREDIEHEIFHEFIRTVHQSLRSKVRRKFDLALTCESEHGEHFEGMDVWTKQKFAKELWEHFADTKIITKGVPKDEEVTESVDSENSDPVVHTFDINALPSGLQKKISDLNQKITMRMKQMIDGDEAYQDLHNDPSIQALIMDIAGRTSAGSDIGHTEVKEENGVYYGSIMVTPEINLASYKNHQESLTALLKSIVSQLKESIRDSDTKDLKFMGSQFILILEPEYAKMLVEHADDTSPAVESAWLPDLDVYHMMHAYEEATGNGVYYLGNGMMMAFSGDPDGYVESVDDFITEAKALKVFKKALKSTSKHAASRVTKVSSAIADKLFKKLSKDKKRFTLEEFKQRYQYDSETSTILIDGDRIKVDIDITNPFVKVGDTYVPRGIACMMNADEPLIMLNKNFFKLSKDEYQDAILRHELGHAKFHSINLNNKLLDRRYIDEDIIREMMKEIAPSGLLAKDPDEYADQMMNDPYIRHLLGAKVNDENINKAMTIIKQRAAEYKKMTKNKHFSASEMMADGYAAKKTSPDALLDGLKELNGRASSSKNMKKTIQAMRAAQKMNSTDMITGKKISDVQIDPSTIKVHPLDTMVGKYATKALNRSEFKARKKALQDKELFDVMPESVIFDPFIESDNATPEYNVDMTPMEAKRTLATLSASILNNMEKDPKYFISQYTADIYSNVITKNLLPIWAHGYQRFHIQLTDRQSFFTVEFKVPKMTQDFIARYIEGRETIDGLLHRTSEIKVKISPRVFQSMKTPDDAFNFFRSLIKYYDTGIARYADKFHKEIAKMSKELKYLVSTTRLSGLVAIPFQMLVVFNDVHMDDKDAFKITASDVNAINQFIRNIYSNYPAPAKNRKQIIDDLNTVVRHLNENCEFRENLEIVRSTIQGVKELENGAYQEAVDHFKVIWEAEQVDTVATYQSENGEFKYLQEKFGVKKLKKIPRDIVAYITIEAESIQDANDKMMIASYCLGKLEIVEWYIELIDTANPKYVVPHPRLYLVSLRTQLLDCYNKIMDTKIQNSANRPIIKVDYPAGLEG